MKPAFYKSEVVTLFRRQFIEMEIFRRNFEKLDEVFIELTPASNPLTYTDTMTTWLREYTKDLINLNRRKLKEFANEIKSELKELNFKSEIVRQLKEVQSEVDNEIYSIWEILTSHKLDAAGNKVAMSLVENFMDKVFQLNKIDNVEDTQELFYGEKVNIYKGEKKRIQRVIKIKKEKLQYKDPVKELKKKVKFRVKEVEINQLKSAKLVIFLNNFFLANFIHQRK